MGPPIMNPQHRCYKQPVGSELPVTNNGFMVNVDDTLGY